jgi:hypothetical protein
MRRKFHRVLYFKIEVQRTSVATRSLDWNDVASCAALGLDVLEDMRKALTGKRITREFVEGVLKKSIKKVATRLSGVVEVSITVAEFGVCLAIAS